MGFCPFIHSFIHSFSHSEFILPTCTCKNKSRSYKYIITPQGFLLHLIIRVYSTEQKRRDRKQKQKKKKKKKIIRV